MISKEDKKEMKKGITGNIMRIHIYRSNGDSPPIEISTLLAKMQKDKNQNIVLVNEESNFKEDLFITRDALVSFILDRVKSTGESKEKQLGYLREKISNQQKVLLKVKDGKIKISDIPEGSEDLLDKAKELIALSKSKDKQADEYLRVNVIDEEEKLRLLEIAEYSLIHEELGSYETVDTDQLRAMHFLSQDGLLYPYFWGKNKKDGKALLIHPDVSTRKKYYKSEDDLIEEERKRDMQNKVGNVLKIIGIIAMCLLFCINIFWSIQNSKQNSELLKQWDESSISKIVQRIDGAESICTRALSSQVEDNGVLIDYALTKIRSEKEKIVQENKEQTPKINKI